MTHDGSAMTGPQGTPALKPQTLRGEVGIGYFPIAFIARIPFAMMVVGVMTLVVSARGSMSLGGMTSAFVGLGAATVGPFHGMFADRLGQRGVLLAAAAANSAALLFIAWAAYADVANGVVLAAAYLCGATGPQVLPMTRSRLVAIIRTRFPQGEQLRVMRGTLAYESAADEVVFVFGPVVVGVLATTMSPRAPIIGAAILTAIFVVAFALHSSARAVLPKRQGDGLDQAPARELGSLRLIVAYLAALGAGAFFGTTLTSLTAFLDDIGQPERAGLLYGVLGIGSAILALATATLPATFSMRLRLLCFVSVIAVGAVLLAQAETTTDLVWALAIGGLGIGPFLVTMFTLATDRSPSGRSSTTMSIVQASVTVGQSGAAAIVGAIAENGSTETALRTPLIAVAIMAVAGVGNWFLSPRHQPSHLS